MLNYIIIKISILIVLVVLFAYLKLANNVSKQWKTRGIIFIPFIIGYLASSLYNDMAK